jgi:hypothetical protein
VYFGNYGVSGVNLVILEFLGLSCSCSLLCFRVILFILEFSRLFLSF